MTRERALAMEASRRDGRPYSPISLPVALGRLNRRWSLYLAVFEPGVLKVGITSNLGERSKGLSQQARTHARLQIRWTEILRSVEVGDYWDAHAYEDAIVARCRPFTLATTHHRSEWFRDVPFIRELFSTVTDMLEAA
jgi:hypothetical protein